jgi:hypothetical protein
MLYEFIYPSPLDRNQRSVVGQRYHILPFIGWMMWRVYDAMLPNVPWIEEYGMADVMLVLTGLWCGLGLETKFNGGQIRIVVRLWTLMLLFLPTRVSMSHEWIRVGITAVYCTCVYCMMRLNDHLHRPLSAFTYVVSLPWILYTTGAKERLGFSIGYTIWYMYLYQRRVRKVPSTKGTKASATPTLQNTPTPRGGMKPKSFSDKSRDPLWNVMKKNRYHVTQLPIYDPNLPDRIHTTEGFALKD